jgi:hypothetical protein
MGIPPGREICIGPFKSPVVASSTSHSSGKSMLCIVGFVRSSLGEIVIESSYSISSVSLSSSKEISSKDLSLCYRLWFNNNDGRIVFIEMNSGNSDIKSSILLLASEI